MPELKELDKTALIYIGLCKDGVHMGCGGIMGKGPGSGLRAPHAPFYGKPESHRNGCINRLKKSGLITSDENGKFFVTELGKETIAQLKTMQNVESFNLVWQHWAFNNGYTTIHNKNLIVMSKNEWNEMIEKSKKSGNYRSSIQLVDAKIVSSI